MHTVAADEFDALRGGSAPTSLFGPLAPNSVSLNALAELSSTAAGAAERIFSIYGVRIAPDAQGVEALDSIVREIWREHWPGRTSTAFDLFARDLGLLLTIALLPLPGLSPVFRSGSDLTHFSVWAQVSATEYFPFHKVAKALSRPDGESLTYFFRAIQQTTAPA